MEKFKKQLKPIVILQLSDLHFGMDDSDRTQESAVVSFLESFQNLPEDWEPDILVISGDLTNSGQDSEYGQAAQFLNKFLSLQKCSKLTKNDIIICPGNHDVNISVQDIQRPTPRCEKDSELIPLQKNNLAVYLYKFENYIKFLKDFGIPCYDNSALTSNTSSDEKIRYLYGFRQTKDVNFICLNSEWDFNIFKQDSRGNFTIYDKAEGCLRLGAELYKDGISSKNQQQCRDDCENNILITVFHRPISDMHKDEYSSYNNRPSNSRKLITSNSHIVLNGHKHINDDLYDQGNCLFYLCGTFCSKDTKSY